MASDHVGRSKLLHSRDARGGGALVSVPTAAMSSDVESLASQIVEGSTRALARGLTWVESGGTRAEALCARLYPHTGRAQIVGVTGAPGSGKSTLARSLALVARARGRTVGILAVDPSSPFSGGAILGDRIRMSDLTLDPGVFIRSMATRGALGGLSRAAADGVDLMDAAGLGLILAETVLAGALGPEGASRESLLERVARRELAPHACARALLAQAADRASSTTEGDDVA